jgi:hypothetical protein
MLNDTDTTQEMVITSSFVNIDLVEVWELNNEGGVNYERDGMTVYSQGRKINYRLPAVPLSIPPRQKTTLFFKFTSELPISITLKAWKEYAFFEQDEYEFAYYGAIFGIFFVVILYNLFLFLSMRDALYLYYCVYIFMVGLVVFSVSGFNNAYLWPQSEWMRVRGNILVTCLVFITSIFYTRKFLDTEHNAPKIDGIIKASMAAYLVFAVSGQLMDVVTADKIAVVLILPYIAIPLVAGIACVVNKKREAKFFLYAWSFVFLGMIFFELCLLGILPMSEALFHSYEGGYVLEAILLSFALADRIAILREEKERARNQIAAQEKNLLKIT